MSAAPTRRAWRTWPLRRRLVTLVALIAAVVIAAGALASTLALRASLVSQLDTRLAATASIGSARGGPGPGHGGPGRSDGTGRDALFTAGIERGTVQYLTGDGGAVGGRVSEDFAVVDLTAEQVDALLAVPEDGAAYSLELPGLGEYRALASSAPAGDRHVTALPLGPVEDALASYAVRQALIGLAGIVLAAGAGAWVIRRELEPLREVAATATRVASVPMDRGAVRVDARVADADPSTEVGQVGAALNTLLGHVESSLAARHASETQVRQFVADASHELRTPLASIAGYTELLRTRTLPPEEAEAALARIAGESARMGALVEDLLLLARLDAGRPLGRGPVDLAALAADAVMDAHAAGRSHTWHLDVPVATDGEVDVDAWTVTGDGDKLRQVLANLLANARLHTPAGITVTLTLRGEPGAVVVKVSDDGPGIPEDLRGKVFDRFARGDDSRARAADDGSGGAPSSGLGLAIVKAIVEAHGGRIAVDSSRAGTAFTVRLPR